MGIINYRINIAFVLPEQSLKQYPKASKWFLVIEVCLGLSSRINIGVQNYPTPKNVKCTFLHPIKECQVCKEARLYDPLLKEKLINRHLPTTDTDLRVRQQGY